MLLIHYIFDIINTMFLYIMGLLHEVLRREPSVVKYRYPIKC